MNLLDENFPGDQAELLSTWRIPFRRIGRDVARLGAKDPEIIPLLHQLRNVTFFTQDLRLGKRALCHPAYCLVCLEVRPDDAALYVRRVLKHPRFKTQARRMGLVIRAHHDWNSGSETLLAFNGSIGLTNRERAQWQQRPDHHLDIGRWISYHSTPFKTS